MLKNSELIVESTLTGLSAFVTMIMLNGFATLIAWPVWNWIACGIFRLPYLSFMQTWGLLILCAFLFKGNFSTSSN